MARRRTSTVVKGRFVRPGSSRTTPAAQRGRPGAGARRQINAALRYIETRPLGPHERAEDRVLFNRDHEGIDRRAARDELARWVTPGVAYHSLVLSPGPVGKQMDVEQMRDWTRQIMADLERQWGVQLTWYATIHQHTSHIHAHVIVAASHERHTPSGSSKRTSTRFGRADYALMRESGDRWAEHQHQLSQLFHEAERYAAELVLSAVAGLQGGGGGRGPTDRDEIDRTSWPRR